MKTLQRTSTRFLFLSIGLLWACDRPPTDWTPVLEHTSTTFLETETNRALEAVRSATARIPSDPQGAEGELKKAESALQYLRDFYLPLFQGRERAYNAFRYHKLGDTGQVDRELELIEETLASMVVTTGGGPHRELQSLAEDVAAARVAARGSPAEAERALEALARRLDQAVLKGDLITGSG